MYGLTGTELTALGGMIATLLGAIGLIYKIQQESRRAAEENEIKLEEFKSNIQTISFTQLEKTMPGLTNLVDWYETKTLACEARCGEVEKRLDKALKELDCARTDVRHLTLQVQELKALRRLDAQKITALEHELDHYKQAKGAK